VQQNETNTKQDEAEWDGINGRKKNRNIFHGTLIFQTVSGGNSD